MLTLEERLDNIESMLVQLVNDSKNLATDDELDAVVTQIFDTIDSLEDRVSALKNNLAIVKEILAAATG